MPAHPAPTNDVTERDRLWRRLTGDEWAAFDALPPAVRKRLHEHAYDPWAVNALMLWRLFRRRTGDSARAERRLLNHIAACERLEFREFAAAQTARWVNAPPQPGAGVAVLRYESARRRQPP